MPEQPYPLLGPRDRFDPNPGWDEFDWQCLSLDRWVRSSPPEEALRRLVDAIAGFDDHQLCQVGVVILEPLVDGSWSEIRDTFFEVLETSVNLRKALSCAWLDIDDGDERRMRALIRPTEQVGTRTDDTRSPGGEWRATHGEPMRTVRLPQLLAALARARRVGLAKAPDPEQVERVADPGAAHLLWKRFACAPPRGAGPTFYRCGLQLFCPHQRHPRVVLECDLLPPDVDALAIVGIERLTILLRSALETLPSIEDV